MSLRRSARIRLILGTDEERTCSCVEHYDADCEIPDFAITPDAEFPVIYAEKGILHVKVSDTRPVLSGFTAKGGNAANMVAPSCSAAYNGKTYDCQGKMAHASKPDLGINAIDMLPAKLEGEGFDLNEVPLLKFIKTFDPKAVCDVEDDSGKMTTNSGILKIDEEEQSLIIDIRYPVTSSLEDILTNIRAQAEVYGLEVTVDSQMDPIYKDKDSEEIKLLTSIWKEHMSKFTGYKDEYADIYGDPLAIGGGTYARHMRNTIAFGIQAPWQEDQCHQANEHIAVSDFEECIKIIKDTLIKLCQA
jgi:succinyl-diaminopimelate desuccinylase